MKLPLLLASLTLVTTASAQSLERWALPDPDEMIKATNVLCADQGKSALLAWHYKSQGRTKDEVLALIPESPKAFTLRVTSAMRENVEDAYAFPDVSTYAYYSFRSEVCMRETLGAVRMPRFLAVQPKVAECQKTHGPDKSTPLFKCVQAAVRAASPQ